MIFARKLPGVCFSTTKNSLGEKLSRCLYASYQLNCVYIIIGITKKLPEARFSTTFFLGEKGIMMFVLELSALRRDTYHAIYTKIIRDICT